MFRLSPDTSVRRGGLLTALVALIALALTPLVGAGVLRQRTTTPGTTTRSQLRRGS